MVVSANSHPIAVESQLDARGHCGEAVEFRRKELFFVGVA
jgi:hypothetical protein